MAKKKDNRIVIDASYVRALEDKAQLVDEIFADGDYMTAVVRPTMFKTYDKIQRAWDKLTPGVEYSEPYVEAKEQAAAKDKKGRA